MNRNLRPSVTYISLLAKTPFFRKLPHEHLHWVIEHSEEWYARQETEIVTTLSGPDNFWILLDGAWRIEYGGKSYISRPIGPGNWFGGEWMPVFESPARVVAIELSYVLNISMEHLNEMVRQGFDILEHRTAGVQFYERMRAG